MVDEKKKLNFVFPTVVPPFPPTYSNVSLANHAMKGEISLEFGFVDSLTIAKAKSQGDDPIEVNHVARIIMPISSAKQFYEQLKSRLGK